ncbi:hypothetical protein G4B88_014005 [Cannabis sativa]|uniref:valine--tRNA ligase n=1 Tax=Cannabis sativa TaxID=3483 RepID=A0A7J6I0U7_CANSA|nr:hypothetical protein G4B88_014005 [Cannabis sativa]
MAHEAFRRFSMRTNLLNVFSETDAAPAGCVVSVVNENISVYLDLRGSLSAEAEREKLVKKMEEVQKQKEKLWKKMNASGYKDKVPAKIQEDNEAKLKSLEQEFSALALASEHIKET